MNMFRKILDWTLAIVVITITLMVVWALAGRDFLNDVTTLAVAVVESVNPVDNAYPPCPTEDAPGPCYWNADYMGNGMGDSFTVDRDGDVHYWDD